MTANGRPIPFGVRYGRLRLDGDLDEFHRALAWLAADTCERGRCDPAGSGQCARHEKRDQRRRLREGGGS
jgi:hypothetical protein